MGEDEIILNAVCRSKKSVNKIILVPELSDELAEAADEIDSLRMTYFVDEGGSYHYQPLEDIVDLSSEEEELVQEQSQISEAVTEENATTDPTFQTTLVPSENSNGEFSYVLVKKESEHTSVNNDIKLQIENSVKYYNLVREDCKEKEGEVQKDIVKTRIKGRAKNDIFMCSFCSYSTQRRYLLNSHLKHHSDEKVYGCEVCERKLKTKTALQNHINMHNGIKPHTCTTCSDKFTTSGELMRHVRYKHTHEKRHKCTECDYASVELSKLRRHLRCHTGERPYQCSDCTYASSDSFKLKRHQRIHTGERPYKCDTCIMSFTQSNSLKAHKLCHNVSKKPTFACHLCPSKYSRMSDLRSHVQNLHSSDKPVKCKHCCKSFPDNYTCKVHSKTHNGEKAFRCVVCPYASTTRRQLNFHLLKHTDEKPFECDKCNQSFRQKQLLQRHHNQHHNPDYVQKPPKEKNHACHECNRTFVRKGNLIRHLAIHDPKSGYKEKALSLKIGCQKKFKYINAKIFKDLQDKEQNQTQILTVGMSSEVQQGEVVTVNNHDGQHFVVLEVIDLEDNPKQQMAIVTPDFIKQRLGIDNRAMGMQHSELPNENDDDGSDELETIAEEDIEEDMQTKMQKHRLNQEKFAVEQLMKLGKDVETCFGFDENQDEEVTDELKVYI